MSDKVVISHSLQPLPGKNLIDALDNHAGSISIGGRIVTNLRFADDIDGLAGNENELKELVQLLDRTASTYGI